MEHIENIETQSLCSSVVKKINRKPTQYPPLEEVARSDGGGKHTENSTSMCPMCLKKDP